MESTSNYQLITIHTGKLRNNVVNKELALNMLVEIVCKENIGSTKPESFDEHMEITCYS